MGPNPPSGANFPRRLTFTTIADAALDAREVLGARRFGKVQLVADTVLIVGGVAAGIAGYPLGYFVAIFGILFLVLGDFDLVRRWQANRYFGSLLGRTVTVDVDEESVRFSNDLAQTQFGWSSLTTVRSTPKTVVFLRERAILGYIPSAAFASAEDQRRFVEFARERIAADLASDRD